MNWRTYIESKPEVLNGKPVVKGTRLAVGFLLDLFAQGWTREQVLENYPELNAEGLQAVFAYGAAHLKDEDTFIFSDGTSG
jgi:uncharacterized protein (DUF433 family)